MMLDLKKCFIYLFFCTLKKERGKGRDGEYNDRYKTERRDSSPRYQNKSSYLERTKERSERSKCICVDVF